VFPDGEYVMESLNIAKALEKRFPEPSLHLDDPKLPKVLELVDKIMFCIAPNMLPEVYMSIVPDASKPYWHESRLRWFGIEIMEMKRLHGGEGCYDTAAAPLREVTGLLKDNADNPWFSRDTAGFTDIVWVAFLLCCKCVGNNLFDDFLRSIGDDKQAHLNLLEAARPWIGKDY
jgi:hypothetical protein